jgi:Fe-S oxidoreductase
LEPSCILTLADEWPELVPDRAARRVAAVVDLVDSWLARQVGENRISLPTPHFSGTILIHPHCHQKALIGSQGTADLLRLLCGAKLTVLDAGCCGMAGAFGYEKAHYDLSVQIANLSLIPALQADPTATVVATGTSCRHQIHDLTGRRVFHPLELLAPSADPLRDSG